MIFGIHNGIGISGRMLNTNFCAGVAVLRFGLSGHSPVSTKPLMPAKLARVVEIVRACKHTAGCRKGRIVKVYKGRGNRRFEFLAVWPNQEREKDISSECVLKRERD